MSVKRENLLNYVICLIVCKEEKRIRNGCFASRGDEMGTGRQRRRIGMTKVM